MELKSVTVTIDGKEATLTPDDPNNEATGFHSTDPSLDIKVTQVKSKGDGEVVRMQFGDGSSYEAPCKTEEGKLRICSLSNVDIQGHKNIEFRFAAKAPTLPSQPPPPAEPRREQALPPTLPRPRDAALPDATPADRSGTPTPPAGENYTFRELRPYLEAWLRASYPGETDAQRGARLTGLLKQLDPKHDKARFSKPIVERQLLLYKDHNPERPAAERTPEPTPRDRPGAPPPPQARPSPAEALPTPPAGENYSIRELRPYLEAWLRASYPGETDAQRGARFTGLLKQLDPKHDKATFSKPIVERILLLYKERNSERPAAERTPAERGARPSPVGGPPPSGEPKISLNDTRLFVLREWIPQNYSGETIQQQRQHLKNIVGDGKHAGIIKTPVTAEMRDRILTKYLETHPPKAPAVAPRVAEPGKPVFKLQGTPPEGLVDLGEGKPAVAEKAPPPTRPEPEAAPPPVRPKQRVESSPPVQVSEEEKKAVAEVKASEVAWKKVAKRFDEIMTMAPDAQVRVPLNELLALWDAYTTYASNAETLRELPNKNDPASPSLIGKYDALKKSYVEKNRFITIVEKVCDAQLEELSAAKAAVDKASHSEKPGEFEAARAQFTKRYEALRFDIVTADMDVVVHDKGKRGQRLLDLKRSVAAMKAGPLMSEVEINALAAVKRNEPRLRAALTRLEEVKKLPSDQQARLSLKELAGLWKDITDAVTVYETLPKDSKSEEAKAILKDYEAHKVEYGERKGFAVSVIQRAAAVLQDSLKKAADAPKEIAAKGKRFARELDAAKSKFAEVCQRALSDLQYVASILGNYKTVAQAMVALRDEIGGLQPAKIGPKEEELMRGVEGIKGRLANLRRELPKLSEAQASIVRLGGRLTEKEIVADPFLANARLTTIADQLKLGNLYRYTTDFVAISQDVDDIHNRLNKTDGAFFDQEITGLHAQIDSLQEVIYLAKFSLYDKRKLPPYAQDLEYEWLTEPERRKRTQDSATQLIQGVQMIFGPTEAKLAKDLKWDERLLMPLGGKVDDLKNRWENAHAVLALIQKFESNEYKPAIDERLLSREALAEINKKKLEAAAYEKYRPTKEQLEAAIKVVDTIYARLFTKFGTSNTTNPPYRDEIPEMENQLKTQSAVLDHLLKMVTDLIDGLGSGDFGPADELRQKADEALAHIPVALRRLSEIKPRTPLDSPEKALAEIAPYADQIKRAKTLEELNPIKASLEQALQMATQRSKEPRMQPVLRKIEELRQAVETKIAAVLKSMEPPARTVAAIFKSMGVSLRAALASSDPAEVGRHRAEIVALQTEIKGREDEPGMPSLSKNLADALRQIDTRIANLSRVSDKAATTPKTTPVDAPKALPSDDDLPAQEFLDELDRRRTTVNAVGDDKSQLSDVRVQRARVVEIATVAERRKLEAGMGLVKRRAESLLRSIDTKIAQLSGAAPEAAHAPVHPSSESAAGASYADPGDPPLPSKALGGHAIGREERDLFTKRRAKLIEMQTAAGTSDDAAKLQEDHNRAAYYLKEAQLYGWSGTIKAAKDALKVIDARLAALGSGIPAASQRTPPPPEVKPTPRVEPRVEPKPTPPPSEPAKPAERKPSVAEERAAKAKAEAAEKERVAEEAKAKIGAAMKALDPYRAQLRDARRDIAKVDAMSADRALAELSRMEVIVNTAIAGLKKLYEETPQVKTHAESIIGGLGTVLKQIGIHREKIAQSQGLEGVERRVDALKIKAEGLVSATDLTTMKANLKTLEGIQSDLVTIRDTELRTLKGDTHSLRDKVGNILVTVTNAIGELTEAIRLKVSEAGEAAAPKRGAAEERDAKALRVLNGLVFTAMDVCTEQSRLSAEDLAKEKFDFVLNAYKVLYNYKAAADKFAATYKDSKDPDTIDLIKDYSAKKTLRELTTDRARDHVVTHMTTRAEVARKAAEDASKIADYGKSLKTARHEFDALLKVIRADLAKAVKSVGLDRTPIEADLQSKSAMVHGYKGAVKVAPPPTPPAEPKPDVRPTPAEPKPDRPQKVTPGRPTVVPSNATQWGTPELARQYLSTGTLMVTRIDNGTQSTEDPKELNRMRDELKKILSDATAIQKAYASDAEIVTAAKTLRGSAITVLMYADRRLAPGLCKDQSAPVSICEKTLQELKREIATLKTDPDLPSMSDESVARAEEAIDNGLREIQGRTKSESFTDRLVNFQEMCKWDLSKAPRVSPYDPQSVLLEGLTSSFVNPKVDGDPGSTSMSNIIKRVKEGFTPVKGVVIEVKGSSDATASKIKAALTAAGMSPVKIVVNPYREDNTVDVTFSFSSDGAGKVSNKISETVSNQSANRAKAAKAAEAKRLEPLQKLNKLVSVDLHREGMVMDGGGKSIEFSAPVGDNKQIDLYASRLRAKTAANVLDAVKRMRAQMGLDAIHPSMIMVADPALLAAIFEELDKRKEGGTASITLFSLEPHTSNTVYVINRSANETHSIVEDIDKWGKNGFKDLFPAIRQLGGTVKAVELEKGIKRIRGADRAAARAEKANDLGTVDMSTPAPPAKTPEQMHLTVVTDIKLKNTSAMIYRRQLPAAELEAHKADVADIIQYAKSKGFTKVLVMYNSSDSLKKAGAKYSASASRLEQLRAALGKTRSAEIVSSPVARGNDVVDYIFLKEDGNLQAVGNDYATIMARRKQAQDRSGERRSKDAP